MKNSWAYKIDEFAKPAHKNISVLIQNTPEEDIENVLDAIAKDAQWHYKEIKSKDGKKMLCYQTTVLGEPSLSNFQIIECTLVPQENAIRIDYRITLYSYP